MILEVGATLVFSDIDPYTRNIDLARIEEVIILRTKAIILVYLAGLPSIWTTSDIAQAYELRVIEDAAMRSARHGMENALVSLETSYLSVFIQTKFDVDRRWRTHFKQ